MLAIDDLVRDYGDPQVEQSNKDRLWVLLVEKIAPAGFVAIDILRIEAVFPVYELMSSRPCHYQTRLVGAV